MEKDLIYKRLADVREDSDLKQKTIAEILEICPNTVSKWEQGDGIIPLERLSTICNLTKSTMDYVAGLSQENGPAVVLDKISKETAGSRLREFRIGKNWTQKELAEELKTTQSTISAYECGKTLILSAFAYQIAKKYNVSMDWICGRSDVKNIKKDLTKQ